MEHLFVTITRTDPCTRWFVSKIQPGISVYIKTPKTSTNKNNNEHKVSFPNEKIDLSEEGVRVDLAEKGELKFILQKTNDITNNYHWGALSIQLFRLFKLKVLNDPNGLPMAWPSAVANSVHLFSHCKIITKINVKSIKIYLF